MIQEIPLTQEQIDDELERIELSPIQKQMVKEQTKLIAEKLQMPLLSVRGFFALAMVDWQKQQKLTAAEAEYQLDTSLEARLRSINDIHNYFSKKISRVLKVRKKEHLLEKALEASLKFYTKNYAARSRDKR